MNRDLYEFRVKYERHKDKMDHERNGSIDDPCGMSDMKFGLKYGVSGVSVGKYMEKFEKFMTKVAPNKYIKTNKNYGSGRVIPRDLPTEKHKEEVITDYEKSWRLEAVEPFNGPIKTLFDKI